MPEPADEDGARDDAADEQCSPQRDESAGRPRGGAVSRVAPRIAACDDRCPSVAQHAAPRCSSVAAHTRADRSQRRTACARPLRARRPRSSTTADSDRISEPISRTDAATQAPARSGSPFADRASTARSRPHGHHRTAYAPGPRVGSDPASTPSSRDLACATPSMPLTTRAGGARAGCSGPARQRFAQRQLQHLFASGENGIVPPRLGRSPGPTSLAAPLDARRIADPKRARTTSAAIPPSHAEQREQQVLGSDMAMTHALRARCSATLEQPHGLLGERARTHPEASHSPAAAQASSSEVSPANRATACRSNVHRHPVPPRAGPGGLPSPSFADRRPDASRSTTSPFPSPAGSVPRPAAGRHFGLRQPPDPHKEGTKDERLSTRS